MDVGVPDLSWKLAAWCCVLVWHLSVMRPDDHSRLFCWHCSSRRRAVKQKNGSFTEDGDPFRFSAVTVRDEYRPVWTP